MKTNLLHITYDMSIGGTEQVIKNIVESIDKSKYNISILCINRPIGSFGELLLKKGFQVDSIERKDGFDLSLVYKIRKYLIQHNIDIVHCHQYTPWVYGVLASIASGKKTIFTEHGRFYPDRSSWKRKLINPFLVKMTDHITAISRATKQALVDYESISPTKIDVTYNGIDELEIDKSVTKKLREELSIPTGTLVLGTIARLDPIKNHNLLISSYGAIEKKYPNTRLLIIGDGENRSNLEFLVKNLNIGNKVIFAGYKTNPADYLQLMDIFLLTSLSEGTAMTLLEAMCLCKPCIVTDVGGNPEVVEDKKSGIVTPSGNEAAVVTACELLLKDSDLRLEYGQAGRKRFENQFTVQHMLTQYQEIYRELTT